MNKSVTFMFPNGSHNVDVWCVVGIYDSIKKNGVVFYEVNPLNSYLPIEQREVKRCETTEEFTKEFERRVIERSKENENVPESIFESEKTFLITMYSSSQGTAETILCPSTAINVSELDTGETFVTCFVNTGMKCKLGKVLFIDVTNDPTPACAGYCVSLGYYNWRIEMHNPIVISDNPIVIKAKSSDVKKQFCRICRR